MAVKSSITLGPDRPEEPLQAFPDEHGRWRPQVEVHLAGRILHSLVE